jgi:hypothetical protein
MLTERNMPANDDAGTMDTSDARNKVRRARIARIGLLLS